jgi:hypothetical protein
MSGTTITRHAPLTLLVASSECLDRECEEYFTEAGDDDPGVERCSHIREQQVFVGCSVQLPDGDWAPVVDWPCTPAAPSDVDARGTR